MSETEQKANLERDLTDDQRIKDLVCGSEDFAGRLYAALCNIRWFHDRSGEEWTCTWRYAGGVVAHLVARGEDYLSYYCGGNEGIVAPDIAAELKRLGWSWKEYEQED